MSARARQRALAGTLAFLLACGGTQVTKPAAPEVVVLDAGAEPRQRLLRDLRAGTTERAELVSKTAILIRFTNTVLEEGQTRSEPPAVRIVQRIDVAKRHDNGDAELVFQIEEAELLDAISDAGLRARLDAELAAAKRTHGRARVTPSGKLVDIGFEGPPRVRDRLARIAEVTRLTAIEFPATPIGVGARWEIRSRFVESGIAWNHVTTCALTAFDGEIATVTIAATATAPSQALSVEPRATTRLTSGSLTGRGEVRIPLHRFAVQGSSTTQGELNMQIVRDRLRIISTTTITTDATFQPR